MAQIHMILPTIKAHQCANLRGGVCMCGPRMCSEAGDKCLSSAVLAPFTPRSHV